MLARLWLAVKRVVANSSEPTVPILGIIVDSSLPLREDRAL
jgi:hypothetical protein